MRGWGESIEELKNPEVPTLSIWWNREVGGEFHLRQFRILGEEQTQRGGRQDGLHRGWWLPVEGTEATGPRGAREWCRQHLLYQDPCIFLLAKLQLMFIEEW